MLFKNKYVICIYQLGKDETCVGEFDNVRQLAKYIDRSVIITNNIVSYHFKNRNREKPRKININNVCYEIAFINVCD